MPIDSLPMSIPTFGTRAHLPSAAQAAAHPDAALLADLARQFDITSSVVIALTTSVFVLAYGELMHSSAYMREREANGRIQRSARYSWAR